MKSSKPFKLTPAGAAKGLLQGDLRRRPVRRGRGGGVRTRRWTRAADAVDEASGIDQAPVTLRDAGR